MNDWDDYRFFLAVSETGSLSAAARRLGVTQPTVGRRISDLERRLGARLFDRMSHGYELTAAGQRISELAARIEYTAFAIEQRVSGEDAQLNGRVSITTSEGLGICWLAPRLAKLRERYPDIDIELVLGIGALDLVRREADVALRIGNPGCEELVGRRVGDVHCGLYASDAYLARHGEPTTLDDLSHHTIIESVRELANLAQVRRLRDIAKAAKVGVRCNNITAQVVAARAGLGILALPNYMVGCAPGLRRVLACLFDSKLDLWLLTHRDLRQTARVRAVLDFLAAELRDDTGNLTGKVTTLAA